MGSAYKDKSFNSKNKEIIGNGYNSANDKLNEILIKYPIDLGQIEILLDNYNKILNDENNSRLYEDNKMIMPINFWIKIKNLLEKKSNVKKLEDIVKINLKKNEIIKFKNW